MSRMPVSGPPVHHEASSHSSLEKHDEQFIERTEKGDTQYSAGFDAAVYDARREARLKRKVDFRIIPILALIYVVSAVDRTNISNARVAGMGTELQLLVGERYSIALLTFFPTYFFVELPANAICRKLGASKWLPSIAVCWGIVMLGMAFVTTWQQLTALRVLVGLFEGGYFPGAVYLISCWYKRHEVQVRLAFFYLGAVTVSGFGNILAYGLSRIPARGVLHTWRWIFFVEGILTIAIGIGAYFVVVDHPSTSKFLSKEDLAFMMHRVEQDRGDTVADGLTTKKVLTALGDWKNWAFAMIFLDTAMLAYAMAYFLPVILRVGLKYSEKDAQILSAPPTIVAAVVCIGISKLSDMTKHRAGFIALMAICGIVGMAIFGFTSNPHVRYFGTFLAAMGAYGNVPAAIGYQANNIAGDSNRAICSALTVGSGAVGGVFASLIFRQKDSPNYRPGIASAMGCQALTLFILVVLSLTFKAKNAKMDRGELVVFDRPNFRYTI